MKKLVICGDSFAKGMGCWDIENEPYGSIVAKELGLELVNIAKGSSTNYSIFLQVLYAIEHIDNIGLILITNTSYDRIEWFKNNTTARTYFPTNFDVNYHEYPPYKPGSYGPKINGEEHFMDKNKYNGIMFTENLHGVIDYFDNVVGTEHELPKGYYERFYNEPKERTKIIYDFTKYIHDPIINRMHSFGAITMCHIALKNANIPHIIGTEKIDEFKNFMFIDNKNHMNLSWDILAEKYPDDLPSLHTSAKGHKIAAEIALNKIKENKWDKTIWQD